MKLLWNKIKQYWLPYGIFVIWGVLLLLEPLGHKNTLVTTNGWVIILSIIGSLGQGLLVGYLIVKATLGKKYEKIPGLSYIIDQIYENDK